MKKKLLLGLLVLIGLVTITACGKKGEFSFKSESRNNTYTCKNTSESSGFKYLTSYTIELNSKNEPVKYSMKDGFGNYGDDVESFNNYCDGLKKSKENNKEKIEKYKNAGTMDVVCDDKNMDAYYVMTYNLDVIKDIDDYKNVNNEISKYTKADGTFDLDAWKNYFNTDSLKKGKYTCDF